METIRLLIVEDNPVDGAFAILSLHLKTCRDFLGSFTRRLYQKVQAKISLRAGQFLSTLGPEQVWK
jgi:hypothetical protein